MPKRRGLGSPSGPTRFGGMARPRFRSAPAKARWRSAKGGTDFILLCASEHDRFGAPCLGLELRPGRYLGIPLDQRRQRTQALDHTREESPHDVVHRAVMGVDQKRPLLVVLFSCVAGEMNL